MKTYTGEITCYYCKKVVKWEYRDNGFRPGMTSYQTEVEKCEFDKDIAYCKRIFRHDNGSDVLTMYCPYCGTNLSIPYTEHTQEECVP